MYQEYFGEFSTQQMYVTFSLLVSYLLEIFVDIYTKINIENI